MRIDPDLVPAALRSLVSLAEDWGSLESEGDQLERVSHSSDEELRALMAAVRPHLDAIDGWFDSFPLGGESPAAWAFYYLARAHDLAGYRFEEPPDRSAIELAKRQLAAADDDFDAALRRLDESDDMSNGPRRTR